MRVEQVKACLCLEMGFQRRWGGIKVNKGGDRWVHSFWTLSRLEFLKGTS